MDYQRSFALREERQPESPLVRELHDELAALPCERAMPEGPLPDEQHRPTRPERSLTAPDRRELDRNHPKAGTLVSRRHAVQLRHKGDAAGRTEGQLLRIRSALVYRGCRRQQS
jgi:hypothetical protein